MQFRENDRQLGTSSFASSRIQRQRTKAINRGYLTTEADSTAVNSIEHIESESIEGLGLEKIDFAEQDSIPLAA